MAKRLLVRVWKRVLCDQLAYRFCQLACLLFIGLGRNNNELLTAPAGKRIGIPCRTGHQFSQRVQHLVAGQVPMFIIEKLEIVEINEQE